MTTDEILDGLLAREGGWRDAVERPDGTWDPATNKGVTIDTLRKWRQRGAREKVLVTLEDLRNISDETARLIYQEMYIDDPGFTSANIPFEPLRVQLIDFGVNSGPPTAVRWLQRVLGFEGAHVDGVLGPITVDRLDVACSSHVCAPAWINDALVAARLYMVDRATDQGSMRKADEEGVESRALEFFLARP